MGNNGGTRRTDEQIKSDMEKSIQYLTSLAKSRNRVNSPGFGHLNIKLTDTRLLTLLLAICEHKKLYLPDFVSELLTSALRSRDKIWRQYFIDINMNVDLENAQVMKFSKLECGTDFQAEQNERMNGKVT
jgi:hypothetical protein